MIYLKITVFTIDSYRFYIGIFLFFFSFIVNGQVGINNNNPKGVLDVSSINNTGLVLPRVTAIEDVTDGNVNPPVNGTTVYDLSRNTTCFYQNGSWLCIGVDTNGNPILIDETFGFNNNDIDYIKPSTNNATIPFGLSVALSEDGNTLAVGSNYESSNATGINGDQLNNLAPISGAVYVFVRVSGVWSQQAYIKASNTEGLDGFGFDITLSHDGNILAVGAPGEDSNASGINGDETNNAILSSGAVYVFSRSGTIWIQQAYIKASNVAEDYDVFGNSVVLSGDGNTLAVGAEQEDSNSTGINGDQLDNTATNSGAVYVFTKTGNMWNQEAYIKASNTNGGDHFGHFIALSQNGNTLVVSAEAEDSNATGINGNQADNSSQSSGAVYIFDRVGTTWNQQAYIKPSNTGLADVFGGANNALIIFAGSFGSSITLSDDGNTLAVGASAEDSNAIGINGNQLDNSSTNSGAVYVFVRSGVTWSQQAYIKASNAETLDYFGYVVELSNDGNTLAVSAPSEDSDAIGINGDQLDNSMTLSGAVYVFKRDGTIWTQSTYVKASNTGIDPWTSDGDYFGYSMALSGNGNTLAVGAPGEDGNATGINGNQANNSSQDSGAVYIYNAN